MRYMTRLTGQFARFVICGIINTLVTYLIYLGCLYRVSYAIAYTISFVSGIFISYYLNSRYAFRQEMSWRKALKYPAVYLAQYLLGIGSLYLLVELIGVSKVIAPVFVVLITVPATFLLSRRVITGGEAAEEAYGQDQKTSSEEGDLR